MRNAENKKRRRAHGVRRKEKEERFRVQSSEVEIISPLSV
jgi:hypothetical protein